MCLSPPIRWVQQWHNTWNKVFLSVNDFLSCMQLFTLHNRHKSRSNRKAKEEMAMAFPRLGGWMDGICNLRLQSHKHMDLFGSYTHSTPCGASCYALKHTNKRKNNKKTHTPTAEHTDVLDAWNYDTENCSYSLLLGWKGTFVLDPMKLWKECSRIEHSIFAASHPVWLGHTEIKVGYEVPLRGVLCLPSKLWHTKAFFKSPSLPTKRVIPLLLSSLLATGDQFYGLPFIAAAVLVALWWPCWIPPVTIIPSECPATNLVWSSVLVKSSSKQLPQQPQQHIACCYMSLVSEWWNTASNPSSSLGALAY